MRTRVEAVLYRFVAVVTDRVVGAESHQQESVANCDAVVEGEPYEG
jgi:hypothetical protein